jgi:TolA-binding protein
METRRGDMERLRASRRASIIKRRPEPANRAEQRLRLAKQFIEIGRTETGYNWLRKLVDQYPNSEAADEAQELLVASSNHHDSTN